MRVLVAASSRHGATGEIADEVGRTLEERGLDVQVASLDDVTDVSGFDAFVLGSAVYVGRWLGPARTFVEEHARELAAEADVALLERPDRRPAQAGRRGRRQRRRPGRGERRAGAPPLHRRLDRSRLGLGERAVVRVVGAAEGDYRDWDDVREWAGTIADALTAAS